MNRKAILAGYGSHLPILDTVCSIVESPSVVEFGAGIQSTPFLLNRCGSLISVEHHAGWLRRTVQRVTRECVPPVPWTIVLWPTSAVQEAVAEFPAGDFHLVLVDGPGESRAATLEAVLTRAAFVVIHDTEASCYGLHGVMSGLPGRGFHTYTYTGQMPWTSVVSRDLAALRRIAIEHGGSPELIDRNPEPVL